MADGEDNFWYPTPENLKWFSQIQKLPNGDYRKRYLLSKSTLNNGLPNRPSVLGFGRYTRRGPERIIFSCIPRIPGPNCLVPYPVPEKWDEEDEKDGVTWTEWMGINEEYTPLVYEDDGCGIGSQDLE